MTALNSLRAEVKQVLEGAGIRAIEYAENKVVPPIAVVVPDEPYIVRPEASRANTFGEFNVGIRVLLIAGKGTSKVQANELDSMIEKAVVALEDFDVVEVTAPGETVLNGVSHFGSIISIEATLKFEEE